ncbi:MAG: hypothetical protein AAFR61_23285 [Bacteroidota bacterium]
MLRFTQKVFNNEKGEPEVQWRGNIRHVQGGEEKRFSEFEEALGFIQSKLADLTISAMEDKPLEEQKGILSKSFDLWKKMATDAPRMVMETIKDPKKQVSQLQDQLQDQLQEQIEQVKGGFSQKLDLSSWLTSSKADYQQIVQLLGQLSKDVEALNQKVEQLSNQDEA